MPFLHVGINAEDLRMLVNCYAQNCIFVKVWLISFLVSLSSLLSPCLYASLSHTL